MGFAVAGVGAGGGTGVAKVAGVGVGTGGVEISGMDGNVGNDGVEGDEGVVVVGVGGLGAKGVAAGAAGRGGTTLEMGAAGFLAKGWIGVLIGCTGIVDVRIGVVSTIISSLRMSESFLICLLGGGGLEIAGAGLGGRGFHVGVAGLGATFAVE